jgi:hypothetical protein
VTGRIDKLAQAPDPALVDRLEALMSEAAIRLERGQDCTAVVAEINALSGGNYPKEYFFELYSWTSERKAAERAAKGPPPRLEAITRGEIEAAVDHASGAKEPNTSFFLDLLAKNLPESDAFGLIYYPYVHELSRDEIVDELLIRHALWETQGAPAVRARLADQAKQVLSDPDAAHWSMQWAEGVLRGSKTGEAD